MVSIEVPVDYGTKCGELYISDGGIITIHCIICNDQYDEFLHYHQHLISIHLIEEDSCDFEEDSDLLDAEYKENVLEEQEVDIRHVLDTHSESDTDLMHDECEDFEADVNAFNADQNSMNGDKILLRPNKQLGRARCTDESILRKYKCTECDFSCKDKSNLTGHMKRHFKSKAFQCSVCKKAFHTSTELKAHFRRHTGDKPFLCTDCGRTFFTSGLLTAHIKRHKNQRDKECEICQKKFFDAASLENHSRVHTGQRPFKCSFPDCSSSFKRRNALDGHMKMHENKREHQCNYCPARFNQKCNLNAHQKSKHLIASNG